MEDDGSSGGAPGLNVGGWTLVRPVGRGSFGVVWEAGKGGKLSAVKLIDKRLSPDSAERLSSELACLTELSHPHVLRLLAFLPSIPACDALSDKQALILELAGGGDVATLLARRGPLLPSVSREIVQHTARGLAHVHAHGITHCDVKVDNLLIAVGVEQAGGAGSRRGSVSHPAVPPSSFPALGGVPPPPSFIPGTHAIKVADFGLSVLGSAASGDALGKEDSSKVEAGSLYYLPPEALPSQEGAGRAPHRSIAPSRDVWGLGVVLFFLLTSHLPFVSRSVTDAARALEAAAVSPRSSESPTEGRDDKGGERGVSASASPRSPHNAAGPAVPTTARRAGITCPSPSPTPRPTLHQPMPSGATTRPTLHAPPSAAGAPPTSTGPRTSPTPPRTGAHGSGGSSAGGGAVEPRAGVHGGGWAAGGRVGPLSIKGGRAEGDSAASSASTLDTPHVRGRPPPSPAHNHGAKGGCSPASSSSNHGMVGRQRSASQLSCGSDEVGGTRDVHVGVSSPSSLDSAHTHATFGPPHAWYEAAEGTLDPAVVVAETHEAIRRGVRDAGMGAKLEWVATHVSPAVRALLLAMLHPDPVERPSMHDVLQHPWVAHAGGAALALDLLADG